MIQPNSQKIIQNHRIYHKFSIEKKIESGLVLLGWEVKAIREKTINIDNSYVSFTNQEAYIYNSCFHRKNMDNDITYNPTRTRKLLLKKHELQLLKEKVQRRGYTIVILSLSWKNAWIKAIIALAKGKKQYDKRHIINTNKWKNEKKYITICNNK